MLPNWSFNRWPAADARLTLRSWILVRPLSGSYCRCRRTAMGQLWVGSTNLPDERAAVQGSFRLSGRNPAHCRPTRPLRSTAAQAEQFELVLWQVPKCTGRTDGDHVKKPTVGCWPFSAPRQTTPTGRSMTLAATGRASATPTNCTF